MKSGPGNPVTTKTQSDRSTKGQSTKITGAQRWYKAEHQSGRDNTVDQPEEWTVVIAKTTQ